ncbi:MAG TPA: MFS transporter, partial [Micromonosporaceae bacterium]
VRPLIVARAVNQLGAFSLPYLTVLLTSSMHASLAAAGAIMTAFGVATIPSRLIGGRLVGILGHRRTIIVGLLACACAQAGLASAHRLGTAAVFAVLLGGAFEIYEPASQGAIADAVDADHRVRAYGHLNAALAAAGIGAGILGAVIGRWSLRGLFVADALTCVLCAAIVALTVAGSQPVAVDEADAVPIPVRPWRDRALLLMLVLGVAFAVIYLSVAIGLPLTLSRLGHPAADAGWLFAVSGLTIVVGQPLLRRGTGHWPLPIGTLVVALGLIGYALAHSLAAFIVATVVWSLGDVLIIGHATAIVASLAPPDGRSRYLAAYGISWGIAGLLTPTAVTQVLAHAGIATLWTVLGALAALLALAQTLVIRRLT